MSSAGPSSVSMRRRYCSTGPAGRSGVNTASIPPLPANRHTGIDTDPPAASRYSIDTAARRRRPGGDRTRPPLDKTLSGRYFRPGGKLNDGIAVFAREPVDPLWCCHRTVRHAQKDHWTQLWQRHEKCNLSRLLDVDSVSRQQSGCSGVTSAVTSQ